MRRTVGKKSKGEDWVEPVVPAYLPPEPATATLHDPPSDSIGLGTDVSPAPFGDEAVWDGSSWVSSPELLADRRAQGSERFELSSVRLLKAIAYAILSLVAVTFAAAAAVLPRIKDHEAVAFSALGLAGVLALVSLYYLWRRSRPR